MQAEKYASCIREAVVLRLAALAVLLVPGHAFFLAANRRQHNASIEVGQQSCARCFEVGTDGVVQGTQGGCAPNEHGECSMYGFICSASITTYEKCYGPVPPVPQAEPLQPIQQTMDFMGSIKRGILARRAQCSGTTLSLTVSGYEGKFALPAAHLGATAQRGCIFQNKKYEDGQMLFRCKSNGEWALAESTCTDCVPDGCPARSFALTRGGHNGTFAVPCGSPNQLLRRPCVFQDERYEKGSVTFACKAGQWDLAEDSCVSPLSGGCDAVRFAVSVEGHEAAHDLPIGKAGDHLEAPCVFPDKTYVDGGVRFYCADRAWQFLGNSCSNCKSGGCYERSIKLNFKGHESDYKLPCGKIDDHVAIPCVFRDKSYMSGFVNFACKNRVWKHENSTCYD